MNFPAAGCWMRLRSGYRPPCVTPNTRRNRMNETRRNATYHSRETVQTTGASAIIEEPFDQVSLAIQREIGRALNDPVCLGRDDRSDLTLPKTVDEGVRIISFVGQKGLWVDLIKQ